MWLQKQKSGKNSVNVQTSGSSITTSGGSSNIYIGNLRIKTSGNLVMMEVPEGTNVSINGQEVWPTK